MYANGFPVHGFAPDQRLGWFTFSPNTTSNPDTAYILGPLKRFVTSITYSATGVQTIVFDPSFTFPNTPRFKVTPVANTLTNWFQADVTTTYNTSTRTLVITTHRAGVGEAVAASTGAAYVIVELLVSNSGGL